MSETPLDLAAIRARADAATAGPWTWERARFDAEFTTHARPALLAEVERLRAENVALRSAYREIAALWAKELNDARDAGGLTVCHNLGCMVVFHAADRCPACNDEPANPTELAGDEQL